MGRRTDEVAVAVSRAGDRQRSPYTFCTVTAKSVGVSVTLDYNGTAVVLPWASIYSVEPTVGDRVCVVRNGTDRFILGVQL